MNRTTITKLTSLVTAGLLGFGLTACSGGGMAAENEEPATAPTSEEATDTGAADTDTTETDTTETDTEESTGAGEKWSVTVGGQQITMNDAEVICQESGGMMNIVIGSTSGDQEGFAVQLTTGDEPTVKAVALVDAEGNTLAYVEETGMGSATASKDGDVYEVTGEGVVTNLDDPTSMETEPFEVMVDCG